jgi:hypothetical protein
VISVLCPTRHRPGNVQRLVWSAQASAAGLVEFVFYTDDDAPGSVPAGIAAMAGAVVVTGPRLVFSDMWNACYARASADVLMMAADDFVFRTFAWDALVLSEFARYPDQIVLVHGEDGIQGAAMGTHPFLHRRWAETLGYFSPPFFGRDFCDTWLSDLADRIGRRVYLPGLLVEHLHPGVGKAPWDATYAEKLARGGDPDATWAATEGDRARDAMVLLAAMS